MKLRYLSTLVTGPLVFAVHCGDLQGWKGIEEFKITVTQEIHDGAR
jgi:hypothetical protein